MHYFFVTPGIATHFMLPQSLHACACLVLHVLIDNFGFINAGFNIDIADKQGNLVFFIEALPEQVGKCIHIVRDVQEFWLSLKAWQRISVMQIGGNEMALAGRAVIVGKGETVAAVRVSVVAL